MCTPRMGLCSVHCLNICLKLIRPRPGGLCASCSYSYAPIVFSQFCGNARLVLTLPFFESCAARL